jgi:dTDP-glucose pyrophosphorylase/predicted transcriptional regulator
MNNWKKAIVSSDSSMQNAVEVLNASALKIVLVVDEDNCLIGTITDGDIRRALLDHMTFESKVYEFMHINPTVGSSSDSESTIFSVMKNKGLMHIPIVDKNLKVIDIKTLKKLIIKEAFDNPVFLMAGGTGSRLYPLTRSVPKPLLKVGSKPMLEIIIDQFINAGFHNFYISINYKSELIKEYFSDGSKWGITIKYIEEQEPLGTAGSLKLLENIDDDQNLPIVMMNADILTKLDIKELLDFYQFNESFVTMCVREYNFEVPYGVVKTKDTLVTSIEEKPKLNFFVNAGVYIINPSILSFIEKDSYVDMPDLLATIIEDKRKVTMFPVHEYWLDIGIMQHYDMAQEDIQEHFND